MQIDPALVAVAGALSTVAAVLFRIEEQRIKDAKEDAIFWREKALVHMGLAQIAVDEAEKRRSRK